MTAILAVTGLSKRWGGVVAVDAVSFELAAGEVLALIGPNGAGKSTTFNMIGGQIRPDGGRVTLVGRDVTGAGPRRLCGLGVGRTFQIAETYASMTVCENVQIALIAYRRRAWRVGRAAAKYRLADAERLLRFVGLEAQAQAPAGVLAYGDVKRLELAMALTNEPRLLLMDEPTAGMAQAERTALMALVRRLVETDGLAVLFTEHDMDIVFNTADRILVLNRGRLIAQGDAAAIRADQQVQAVYLGGGLS